MGKSDKSKDETTVKPDPALARLDRLIGQWSMKGRSLGSKDDNISGTTTFSWLHGHKDSSFFLQQDMELDYAGTQIKSREIIGYNPKTKAFSSYVYSNMAPDPWPYEWDVQGDAITISIKSDPMDATFHGKFSDDGNVFSGGWRANPGADEVINAPYDITVKRIDR
jgi:hypothetical protein